VVDHLGSLLSYLAAQTPEATLVGPDVEISGAASDSRLVSPGNLFAAMKGANLDGHDFADEAVANGASALLVSRKLPYDLPQIIVPSVRRVLGKISSLIYDNPSSKMRVIGVTGTNGKTTTTYMIETALEFAGIRSGLIGTIETKIAGQSIPALFTTPEAPSLQKWLADMADDRVDTAVMEVS
jgi:UDP-N-acetylmuramoyl-L-alanyl-D-glutamate--2,6-diaminopimelate ligase